MLALYTNMRNKLITMTVKNVYKLSFDQFFFRIPSSWNMCKILSQKYFR